LISTSFRVFRLVAASISDSACFNISCMLVLMLTVRIYVFLNNLATGEWGRCIKKEPHRGGVLLKVLCKRGSIFSLLWAGGCYSLRSSHYYLTASLRDLPALKAGSFIAGILIFWPGLRGFTPVLAALFDTRKVPKPVMVTDSPFFRDLVMLSRRASNTEAASFFVTPAEAAAAFTRSCFVMVLCC
jgi:hypothetical protein